jgi:hypothetical protein
MSWQLKRNDNQATLSLHNQYWWSDEYGWSSLKQSDPVYTLSGAMDIQQGTMLAGRPITLDCSKARIKRMDVETLQDWTMVPELTMTLTHPDGRTFDVMFTRPAISDIDAIKNYRAGDEQGNDAFKANIHLLTV